MSSDFCVQLAPFLRIVVLLIKVIQWAIPVILIIFATLDFFKATASNDEQVMEKAKSAVGKRLLYAVVIFLVPTLISLIFRLLSSSISGDDYTGPTGWISCFNQYFNGE